MVDYHHYQCMTDEAGSVAEHLQARLLSCAFSLQGCKLHMQDWASVFGGIGLARL